VKLERFLRPARRREVKGGERFQKILRKTLRIALQLVLLSFFLFIGHRGYALISEDSFFQVREVQVEGCRKVPQETFLSLIRMEGMPNLFAVKLKEVAKELESHPWVEKVGARKVFPDKILIRVEERKPIAILQLEDLYYIDSKGMIFSRVGDRDDYNYPFLTGLTRQLLEKNSAETKGLLTKALELLRIVNQERALPLKEISEIHMEKTFGIDCFTQAEGLEVRLGWEDFREKLKRLSLVWSDLQKRGFSAALIDCSDLERMVVKKVDQR